MKKQSLKRNIQYNSIEGGEGGGTREPMKSIYRQMDGCFCGRGLWLWYLTLILLFNYFNLFKYNKQWNSHNDYFGHSLLQDARSTFP